mmetsp:Transcript_15640/g.35071  ORF Transcript_15640/g.35071 Transcript_15640/m.35071 type:complete len:82 (+) Transcript_15640:791-1036(+)
MAEAVAVLQVSAKEIPVGILRLKELLEYRRISASNNFINEYIPITRVAENSADGVNCPGPTCCCNDGRGESSSHCCHWLPL